jgi:translation elongation factor EF-Tu-like GTPase
MYLSVCACMCVFSQDDYMVIPERKLDEALLMPIEDVFSISV